MTTHPVHAFAEVARREIPGLTAHDPVSKDTLRRFPVRICTWCDRHIVGEGYEAHGVPFCSWSHFLVWVTHRHHGQGDHGDD